MGNLAASYLWRYIHMLSCYVLKTLCPPFHLHIFPVSPILFSSSLLGVSHVSLDYVTVKLFYSYIFYDTEPPYFWSFSTWSKLELLSGKNETCWQQPWITMSWVRFVNWGRRRVDRYYWRMYIVIHDRSQVKISIFPRYNLGGFAYGCSR